MLIHDHQDPVRTDLLKAYGALQQTGKHAPFNVERIIGKFIDIGGVHHVWVRDKMIATAGQ